MNIFSVLLLVFVSALPACVDEDYDKNDASASFLQAREEYDDQNYTMAIQSLGEFKARFPYSKLATVAELMIADSHFQLEQYEEAAIAYKQFAKLHPKHEKVEFVLYRVGLCWWYGAKEDIDRDQGYTRRAVQEWSELVDRAPNNEYALKARKLIAEGNRRIAENLQFVARFYCKQEKWGACVYRHLMVANEFPQFKDMKKEALREASRGMFVLAKQKAADPDSDKNTYFNLMSAAELEKKAQDLRQEASEL